MSTVNLSLSNKLRELRISHGYTQKYLGNYLNITRQGYAHYEKGGRTPDNQTLLQLASLYALSIDELINNNFIPSMLHEDATYSTNDRVNPENSKTRNIVQPNNSNEKVLLENFRQLTPNSQLDVLEYVKYRVYKGQKQ
ncbi:helix-turn-helix domain-containing protein [Anaerosporobacter sp.]